MTPRSVVHMLLCHVLVHLQVRMGTTPTLPPQIITKKRKVCQ